MSALYRILVVDDDATVRATYRQILQPPESEAGNLAAVIARTPVTGLAPPLFQVEEADQGQAAVAQHRDALLRDEPFQVAFIDMRMPPGWDGLRTAVALRERDPSLYIVIATAFSDYDVNALQAALGHDVVLLHKPFGEEEVFQLARTLSQSWVTRQRLEKATADLETRVLARTAELDRRIREQQALAEIAARFIAHDSEDQLDDAVAWSMARLGRVLSVDLCALFLLCPDGESLALRHEWRAMGIPPLAPAVHTLHRDAIRPAFSRFLRDEAFGIRRLADLPADMDAVRQALGGHAEGLLCVPMQSNGHLTGFIAIGVLDASQDWQAEQEQMLRTAGHLIVRALEAHAASQAILEKQALLSQTEHAAHIGNWRLRADTLVAEFDAEVRRIAGMAPDQTVNMTLLAQFVHPEDWPVLQHSLMDALREGHPHRMVYRLVRPDGSLRWVSCWAEPQLGDNHRVLGLVGMIQDITPQKLAENALRDTQRSLETLLANLPGMAYRCLADADWTMLYTSPGIVELSGYSPEDMSGATRHLDWGRIIHPDDQARVSQTVWDALAQDRPFELTYRIRHADGSLRQVWERGRRTSPPDATPVVLEGFIAYIPQTNQSGQ